MEDISEVEGWDSRLRIETDRWCGVSRDERIGKKCEAGEMEDLEHLLLCCIFMVEERRQMEKLMEETVDGWHEVEDNEKVVVVEEQVCEIAGIQRGVECTISNLLEARPFGHLLRLDYYWSIAPY